MPEAGCFREPGLYAVVPMNVLTDGSLRPNAKLLYGMISSLATARGYCWASNQYLGEPLGLDGKTVSALVRNLSTRGYIRVEVSRDASITLGTERKIYIATFALAAEAPPPPKNEGRGASKKRTPPLKNEAPPPQSCGEGDLQKVESFIGSINKRDNTPYSPPEEAASVDTTKKRRPRGTSANHLPERFEAFYQFYPRRVKREEAQRAWNKLKPDDALIREMGRALKHQAAYWLATGTELQHIPHPSTWLNQKRWTDSPESYPMPCPGSGGSPRVVETGQVPTW